MTGTPTFHLRFVERVIPAPENGAGVGKTVRILQQFHEHTNGKDVAGDSFVQVYGTWKDVRTEKEDA